MNTITRARYDERREMTTATPVLLDRCSARGCDREAEDVVNGKPLCAGHASQALQLENRS